MRRKKARETILMMLAAFAIALMVLKLTYAAVLTITAILESLIFSGVLILGGYYGAKRIASK